MLGLCCYAGFSLAAVSGDYSLAAGHRILIVVASLVVECRLSGAQASVVVAPGLQSAGSVAVVCELSCPTACAIFLDQGSNLCLQLWQVGSLTIRWQGSPTCPPVREGV